MLRSLFGKTHPIPHIPDGERVYAIGDVHGRADCFAELLAQIADDDARRGGAASTIVLLGDLIDRGPDSRGVVDRAIALADEWPRVERLVGNHEELLLRAAAGERAALTLFDKAGGRETLLSYGVSEDRYEAAHLTALATLIVEAVPTAHLDFLASGRDTLVIGDYLFVHAGVRPKVALEAQRVGDLRWMREPFLSDRNWHGAMVVHGHTITDAPVIRSNRIGVDTGAFATGRLTAIGLEGSERWFLATG